MITPETIVDAGTQIGTLVALAPFLKEATPLATKIIDTVSKGIGTVYSPVNTYLNGKAQVAGLKDINKLLENASGDITIKKGDLEVSVSNNNIIDAALITTINKSIKEQINIDEIVAKSVGIIETKINHDYEKISTEEVSEDWALRFFDISKNIRDEEMKNLWSAILADEILTPGSYSLRALEILKNMNRQDAELFTKISKLALSPINGIIFMIGDKELLNYYNVSEIDKINLSELNLLTNGLTYNILENETEYIMVGSKHCIILKNVTSERIGLPMIKLTNVGSEIYKLVENEIDEKVLSDICKSIRKISDKLEIYYTKAELLPDKTIRYSKDLRKM